MFIRVPKNFPDLSNRGFTLVELMIVISIISILTSISVPSFRNYINYLRLRTFRNEVLADIKYLISLSQKYGGNCNVSFNQVRTSNQPNNRFAATLKCFRDSAQIQLTTRPLISFSSIPMTFIFIVIPLLFKLVIMELWLDQVIIFSF